MALIDGDEEEVLAVEDQAADLVAVQVGGPGWKTERHAGGALRRGLALLRCGLDCCAAGWVARRSRQAARKWRCRRVRRSVQVDRGVPVQTRKQRVGRGFTQRCVLGRQLGRGCALGGSLHGGGRRGARGRSRTAGSSVRRGTLPSLKSRSARRRLAHRLPGAVAHHARLTRGAGGVVHADLVQLLVHARVRKVDGELARRDVGRDGRQSQKQDDRRKADEKVGEDELVAQAPE